MTQVITIAGKKILVNVQYSKIGYGYPRLFVELSDELCANIDVTLGTAFPMSKENFDEWLVDAVPVEDGEALLKELGIKVDVLTEWLNSPRR